MRIIAGKWRGKRLLAPEGDTTRPTSERARQALFDMLWHAAWAGRDMVEGARVLDAFAGTGALGLEALSRGAAHVSFLENDPTALVALRANFHGCAGAVGTIFPSNALKPGRATEPCTLVFLDPPYGADCINAALVALRAAGWFAPGALICAEAGPNEIVAAEGFEALDLRIHGKARLHILRA